MILETINNNPIAMDLSDFIKIGDIAQAYKDFMDYEMSFDADCRNALSYEDFCSELGKGYGNSEYIQIARLYMDDTGIVWYDNNY